MLSIVYCTKDSNVSEIERFSVISELDELYNVLLYNKVSFLGIPGNEEGEDIADFIIEHKINIETVYMYTTSNNDLIKKLKLFFFLAKGYQELDFKNNIIMKHEYLDGIFEKAKNKK